MDRRIPPALCPSIHDTSHPTREAFLEAAFELVLPLTDQRTRYRHCLLPSHRHFGLGHDLPWGPSSQQDPPPRGPGSTSLWGPRLRSRTASGICHPHSLGRTPAPPDHGQRPFSSPRPGATQDQVEAQRPTHENVERQTQGKLEVCLGHTHTAVPGATCSSEARERFSSGESPSRNQGSRSTHIPAPCFWGASPADLHIGGIPSVSAH